MWIKPSYINFSSGTDGLFEIRDPSITASFDLAIDNGKIWFAVLQGSWIGSLILILNPMIGMPGCTLCVYMIQLNQRTIKE